MSSNCFLFFFQSSFFSWFTKVRQEPPCCLYIHKNDKFIAAVKWEFTHCRIQQTWAGRLEWAHAKSSECKQKTQMERKEPRNISCLTISAWLEVVIQIFACRDSVCWPISNPQMHTSGTFNNGLTVKTHGRQNPRFAWESVILTSEWYNYEAITGNSKKRARIITLAECRRFTDVFVSLSEYLCVQLATPCCLWLLWRKPRQRQVTLKSFVRLWVEYTSAWKKPRSQIWDFSHRPKKGGLRFSKKNAATHKLSN